MQPDAAIGTGALLALAREAARRAGDLLTDGRSSVDPVRDVAVKSTPTDVVTRLDVAAEETIRRTLLAARPDDVVLGEEGGTSPGQGGVRWVVDPLDGTVNYLYGIPAWAVSVAAEVFGTVEVGVVAVPPLSATYWAVRGGGAFRDGVPLTVSRTSVLSQALLATGFGYDAGLRSRQGAALAGLLPHVRDVRRIGSAALDLCLLAEGRVDLYYERGLNEWDRAAGALVAREAGAVVEVDGDLTVGCPPGLREPFVGLLAAVGA